MGFIALKECELCEINFPEDLVRRLSLMVDFEKISSIYCCPLCALEVVREVHQAPYLEFTCDKVRIMYERAVSWVENLPEQT